MDDAQISIRGKQTKVPSLQVAKLQLITTGTWLKIATVRDEDYCEGNPVGDPEELIQRFKDGGGKADIFAFSQRLPDIFPRYEYPMHWDNAAVLPIKTYSDWWGSLSQETRRNVRLAGKRGLVVSGVPFNDDLVRGIMGIYNETPFRQGRRFWHYGKDFETVKHDNSSYVERSQFIGAYCNSELIGFIKMVYVDRLASIMQILSRTDQQDKRPTNAMIAKAVEICAEKGISHLVYCKYIYHKNHPDALTEFKRRNGFREVLFPKYYVPLTLKGRLSLMLGLHRGVDLLPPRIVAALLQLRARYYQSKLRTGSEVVAADTRRTAAKTPGGDFNRGEQKLAAPLSAGSNSSE